MEYIVSLYIETIDTEYIKKKRDKEHTTNTIFCGCGSTPRNLIRIK